MKASPPKRTPPPAKAKDAQPVLALPARLLKSPVFLMILLTSEGRRRAIARGIRIRLPHFAVLAALDEFGAASQRELSERLGFDASDLVKVLDLLEADALIRRQSDPTDRRRHAIVLTPAGRRYLNTRDAELFAGLAQFLGGLSASEQRTLQELLLRALAHIDPRVRLCAEPPPPPMTTTTRRRRPPSR
jgi:DNA-binding MarR family transcriptional regulator